MAAARRSVHLKTLLDALPPDTRVAGSREREISSLEIDSRAVKRGSLFVALRGLHADGHEFVEQAVRGGAAAIVTEETCELPAGVTAIIVNDSARALSRLADAFYASPSKDLQIVGITGTNGKTTTAQMTGAIMNRAGIPTATIGTIGARFGDRSWTLENTTPLAPELHGLLAELRDLGARGVAMEASSHALSLARVSDVRYSVAALTNVTRDHLDFHKTFDAYAAAKRSLFEMAARCVFNGDDAYGARWAAELAATKPVLTYGESAGSSVRASDLELQPDGSAFSVDGQRMHVRLPGRFNIANALCAIAIARSFGIDDGTSAEGLTTVDRVRGRMESVRQDGISVVVDYAHTPDALANVLATLRETAAGRLLVVFGCGGDRDTGKRPQMGEVAARLADFAYVTSDNPRSEDPQSIIDAVVRGIGSAPHAVEVDRRCAIERAIREAREGDVVLIAGKGHEEHQQIGNAVFPFDDLIVARGALAGRSGSA